METIKLRGTLCRLAENVHGYIGIARLNQRDENATLPGDRLFKATLKISMQVKAAATLVDVATAGMIFPAMTFAVKVAVEEKPELVLQHLNDEQLQRLTNDRCDVKHASLQIRTRRDEFNMKV